MMIYGCGYTMKIIIKKNENENDQVVVNLLENYIKSMPWHTIE